MGTNFLLVTSGDTMPETEEAMKAVMDAWGAWFGSLGEALVYPGNPITPAAKSLSADGTVSDGPIGVSATGYCVIKADSMDAAVEMAKGCPLSLSGGSMTIYETVDM